MCERYEPSAKAPCAAAQRDLWQARSRPRLQPPRCSRTLRYVGQRQRNIAGSAATRFLIAHYRHVRCLKLIGMGVFTAPSACTLLEDHELTSRIAFGRTATCVVDRSNLRCRRFRNASVIGAVDVRRPRERAMRRNQRLGRVRGRNGVPDPRLPAAGMGGSARTGRFRSCGQSRLFTLPGGQ